MDNDPVNIILAWASIPLLIIAGAVFIRVMKKNGPNLPKTWRDTKNCN